MKKYYLAYGSNLNIAQMILRCPTSMPISKTTLNNHQLVYKGSINGLAYLTIEACEGSHIPLGIYEITEQDEQRLDIYEGYPTLYRKVKVNIKIQGQDKKALIYIMNPNFSYQIPSDAYQETCSQGYEDWEFDKSILDQALITTKENIAKKLTK